MPDVSRRAVMVTALGGLGAIGAVASAAAPAVPAVAGGLRRAAASAAAVAAVASADPVRSQFVPAVGGMFRADDGDRSIDLLLTAVEDLPGSTADDEHRFGLLFSASGFVAADGIYTLHRAGMPPLPLFLSPIGPRGMTRTMQAVVNRTA